MSAPVAAYTEPHEAALDEMDRTHGLVALDTARKSLVDSSLF